MRRQQIHSAFGPTTTTIGPPSFNVVPSVPNRNAFVPASASGTTPAGVESAPATPAALGTTPAGATRIPTAPGGSTVPTTP